MIPQSIEGRLRKKILEGMPFILGTTLGESTDSLFDESLVRECAVLFARMLS